MQVPMKTEMNGTFEDAQGWSSNLVIQLSIVLFVITSAFLSTFARKLFLGRK